MKKLFLLIPVMLISLIANAKVTNINNSTADALRLALYNSTAGDTIVMAEGIYEESNSDYIAWRRSNVVMAAEGANVIIKPHVSFRVRGGARAELIGVKIDASELNTLSTSYKNIFETGENVDGNCLILENCEIYGNPTETVIRAQSDKKLDSIIINNCYIHDNAQVILRLESTSMKGVIITNSTIANIANGGSFWVAPMDIKNTTSDAKVIVDHCTFYHNTSISSSYADVTVGYSGSATSDVTITNCIFAQPESYSGSRAINLTNGGTVRNCLTFNYTKSTNGIQGATVKENCIAVDPLFTDAANGVYSFPGNWVTPSISPARGAATDGSDLGDPRWYSAEVLPSTDFASPYQFVGAKALLAGKIWYDDVNEYLYGDGVHNQDYGTATWKFHATKGGVFSIAANINSGNTSTHKLRVEVLDADGNSVGEFAEQTSTLPGTLVLPAAGDYKIILHDDQTWSSVKIDNVTISYIGGAVQAMPGTTNINEAWFSSNGTRTPGEKIVIPSGHQHEGWVKWNVSFANTANYKAKVNINCDNGHNYTVALYRSESDESPITWGEGEQTEDASPLDLGAKEVPAGNYILKVTNAVQYSHAELVSVQFVNAGGGLVNIPGDITLTEAILSSRAYIDGNGEIRFTSDAEHGHVTEESVAWRVNVSKAGYYKFTTSVNSNNGHSYLVSVYNADETVLKGSVPQSGDDIWGAPKTFSTDNIYLEEGEYRVKVQNTTNNSNGRIVSISASYEGGALVNIPNDAIPFEDALLHDGATRDNEGLHFKNAQYVEWNIHVTEGLYTFAATCTSSNYSNLTIKVKQGTSEKYSYTPQYSYTGDKVISSPQWLLDEGDYTLELSNPTSGSGYITTLSATAATDVFILDEDTEDDGSIAAAAETSNQYTFLIKRSFTADKYYTICLPVSSWNDELKLAFGADYELWKMSSATQSGDEISLNFEQCNTESFHAGIPYIIKPSVDVVNPILYNKKEIKNYTNNNVQEFAAADFIGTFYKDVIPAGMSNLYLQNNNLYYSESNNTPIKGMRAWIRLKSQTSAPARARIVLGEQVATEINFVNGESVNGLIKAIENGQLVIIRDGKKYNVMGIKLQ